MDQPEEFLKTPLTETEQLHAEMFFSVAFLTVTFFVSVIATERFTMNCVSGHICSVSSFKSIICVLQFMFFSAVPGVTFVAPPPPPQKKKKKICIPSMPVWY